MGRFFERMKTGMLFLGMFFFSIASVFAVSFEDVAHKKPTGFINDFANMLRNDEELESIAKSVEQETGGEMVVVTIDELPNDYSIETFATELFEVWGIGKKEKNNGVLLLISKNDRAFRIETGYGVEGILPDLLVNRIAKAYLVPNFKRGDYDNGVLQPCSP